MLTIGQLSAETGVPTSTIRFWERKGLLTPDHRQSGQRRYTPAAVRGVAMLRLLQEVGLTLADIRRFREERAITPRSWHTLVADKLTDVERQIAALEHARDLLSHASTCHHDDLLACPGFQEWFAAYLATFPAREQHPRLTCPRPGSDPSRRPNGEVKVTLPPLLGQQSYLCLPWFPPQLRPRHAPAHPASPINHMCHVWCDRSLGASG